MPTNLDRLKKDIDRLLTEGSQLDLAFVISAFGKEIGQEKLSEAGANQLIIDEAVKGAQSFRTDYQAWYSEALAAVRQILPDRLKEFRDLYERPTNRKDIDHLTYRISDAIIGIQTRRAGNIIADETSAIPKLQAQVAIISALRKRFSSSLFEIRQIVQADLFDTEIESARHLLRNKFLRAAGAIAGVVLEKHLQQVCNDHNIILKKKNSTIGDLNEALKIESVIDIPQWRHITLLGDIRNICDHNKQREPTEQQVTDLIDGTDKVLKTIV